MNDLKLLKEGTTHSTTSPKLVEAEGRVKIALARIWSLASLVGALVVVYAVAMYAGKVDGAGLLAIIAGGLGYLAGATSRGGAGGT